MIDYQLQEGKQSRKHNIFTQIINQATTINQKKKGITLFFN